MNNPYSYRSGVDPSMFFGRHEEIISLISRIASGKPLCVSVTGLRRIGKSSLIRHIKSSSFRVTSGIESMNEYLLVFLDFQKLSDIDDRRFFGYLASKLQSSLHEEFGGPLKSAERKRINHCVRLIKESSDIFDIKNEYFEDIVRTITVRLKLKLVIIIDEFDNAMRKLDCETFDFLRALPAEYNIAYITATRLELGDVCRNAELSGFQNIFSVLRLSLLEENEALDLVIQPFERLGISLGDDEIEEAIALAGYHPFFLQVYCYYLFESKQDRVDLTKVARQFFEDAKPIYDEIMESLTEAEIDTLARIAAGKSSKAGIVNILRGKGLLNKDSCLFSMDFEKYLLSLDLHMKADLSAKEDDPTWKSIEDVELGLRELIKEKLFEQYGDSWEDRIKKCLKGAFTDVLKRRDEAKRKYPESDHTPSDNLMDYTYIGQLSSLLISEWQLFQCVFGQGKDSKRKLSEKFSAIIPVRNDKGHFNDVPNNELLRAQVNCTDILTALQRYMGGRGAGSNGEKSNDLPESPDLP